MKKFFLFLFLLFFCFPTQKQNAPVFDFVLHLNIPQEFHQLDPRKSADLTSCSLHFLLYEGLTKMTPHSKKAALGLAKSYTISENGLNYLFTLEKRLDSRGEFITAFDFEKSWKEALSPDFYCPNVHLFYPIKQAKEAKEGQVSIDAVGITALDKEHLLVTLEHPLPSFLEILAFTVFAPYKGDNRFSGAYCIKDFILQDHLILKPNAFYPHLSSPPTLNISFIKDEMTVYHLFEKGLLDLIGSPFTSIPKEVPQEDLNRYQIGHQPTLGICHLLIHPEHPILKQKALRQAIYFEIDRKTITDKIVQLEGRETSFLIPSPLLKSHILPNREKKWEHSKSEDKIELLYPQTTSYHKIAQFIQREFEEKWGLTVTLKPTEFKIYLTALKTQQFDMALNTLYALYADPMSILERFEDSSNPKNYIAYCNPNFIETLKKAKTTINSDLKKSFYQNAETILMEDAWIIPLYETKSTFCYHRHIHGIRTNATGGFNFESVTFSKKTSLD